MIASNAVFSKNANVQKTFLVSIVHAYNLFEHLTGILLDVFQLVTGFKLDQDSTTFLPRDKTNIEVATSSSRLNRDFPALRPEVMHEAKEVNLIDPLWGLETDCASCLGDCLRIKMLLHKNRPPFCKSANVSLYAYVDNICVGFYTASDPSGPVHHNLLIGYLKSASRLTEIRAEIIIGWKQCTVLVR